MWYRIKKWKCPKCDKKVEKKTQKVKAEKVETKKTTVVNEKAAFAWGVLGFFVGFFVVASLFAFCYFFSKVLLTQAQFKCVFDQIYVIGVLRPIGKRSKVFKILDIKSEDDTKLSDDNLRKLIAANYKNLTKSYNKILITGTGDSAVSSSIVKSLDLNGDFMPDLFSNPEVLTVVPDYDAVVLLEQRNYSVFKNIKKEITLISNGGTPIVGAIII